MQECKWHNYIPNFANNVAKIKKNKNKIKKRQHTKQTQGLGLGDVAETCIMYSKK